MYVDNAAMQLVRNPRQFDVIVTDNLLATFFRMSRHADGLDRHAAFGLLNAAGQKCTSQPRIGARHRRARASPILATILSAAMLLRFIR